MFKNKLSGKSKGCKHCCIKIYYIMSYLNNVKWE